MDYSKSILLYQDEPVYGFVLKRRSIMVDAYATLAQRHGSNKSAHYGAVMKHLMTPEQAAIAGYLSNSLEEFARKAGIYADKIKGI